MKTHGVALKTLREGGPSREASGNACCNTQGYAKGTAGQHKRAVYGNPAWGDTQVESNLTDGGTHGKVTRKSTGNLLCDDMKINEGPC